MNITTHDILNNTENFQDIERQISEAVRQQLAEKLELEFKNPLTTIENATEYEKALHHRTVLLNALNQYNNRLAEHKSLEIEDWDKLEVEKREWLILNWLPANSCTLFSGQGGAGKSWMTLQVVCQIACGFNNAFLNPKFKIPSDANDSIEPKHTILATYEDEPAEIKRRLQSLASKMEWINENMKTIKQHLHIVDMRGVGSIWGPGMGNHIANTGNLLPAGYQLQHICEKKKARLLIIDPLSGAFGGNENDRTAVYDFISNLRRWGDSAKCAVLVVGHLPKNAEGKKAGFSGSTAWEAAVRSMWLLSEETDDDDTKKEKEKDKYYALSHTKSNYAKLQNEIQLIKSEQGWWEQADNEEHAIQGYKDYKNTKNTEDTTNGY
ncbi:MAG: AAA family ATPase [Candidatus Poribacteria bacterium]|nr:AAA family ATPase [Candidatus Poribacteria bacterium]